MWPWAIKCLFRTFGKNENPPPSLRAVDNSAQPAWAPMCSGPGRLGPAWLRLGWAWLIWKWSGLARRPGPPRPGFGSRPCSAVWTLTGLAQAWPANLFSSINLVQYYVFATFLNSYVANKNWLAGPGLAGTGGGRQKVITG